MIEDNAVDCDENNYVGEGYNNNNVDDEGDNDDSGDSGDNNDGDDDNFNEYSVMMPIMVMTVIIVK